MPLLQVQHIAKQLMGEVLINNISFEQEANEKIAISGESGAGKTTLLKMIAGLLQLDSGTILFNGKKVTGSQDKLLPGHPQIAYLSQHFELQNNYRVEELIWFENKMPETAATTLFEICEIYHLLHRKTDQLSGGEKQRIALCMLLVKSPLLLILDEPFSNLDPIHTNTLKKVLEDITARLQITCLLTSHSPQDTLPWADKILVMKDGQIIQQGSPEDIYNRPQNEYVAAMFGSYNLIMQKDLALFSNIQSIEKKGQDIIIWPEHFHIVDTTENAVRGIVEKISFLGNSYEVELLVEDVKIIAKCNRMDACKGDEVFVTIRL